MNNPARGFTLIEVMIAVAILGILVALALPSYDTFIKKAKVSEALAITQEAKLAIIDYHMTTGKFPPGGNDLSARNLAIGLDPAESYLSDVITKMWVGPMGVVGVPSTSGHIAITIPLSVNKNSSENSARLISTIEYIDNSYTFICNNSESIYGSEVDHKYLPGSCHN